MVDCPDNTPVLVGVAAVMQKVADHRSAKEPIALMEQALREAAADAGSEELLSRAEQILVPASLYAYSDPGRLLADAIGATAAATLLAELGVSQQHIIDIACQRIQDGEIQAALVVGGEARYRGIMASKAGEEVSLTRQVDVVPDVTLRPEDELWSEVESATGLGMPVGYYAIMDSALRFSQGLTVAEHRDQMAAMYARLSEVAAANDDAWSSEAVAAAFIRDSSPQNRMLAFPYTKLHNSQWNVDQAAGLILCSAGLARELGVPRQKWVYPRASAQSNFMSVVASRKQLGGCAGFRLAGQAVQELAGVSFNDLHLCELYSCFPFAVRAQIEEMGIAANANISVTGGMTFGGGPLNNFVFQATVKMAQLLREQPGEIGLVTTVSGMLTKQACALWSGEYGASGWALADVTDAVRDATELCELVADAEGEGTVAGYTVLYQGDTPWRAVAVFDLADGRRTVAYSEEASIIETMQGSECCGQNFTLGAGQFR
ncbi:MAG: acetyl-CoA acetyltransferase [Halioglobus sp.]|nr:acetyl-CoA acetyltransferase [Halioglobus sp.]